MLAGCCRQALRHFNVCSSLLLHRHACVACAMCAALKGQMCVHLSCCKGHASVVVCRVGVRRVGVRRVVLCRVGVCQQLRVGAAACLCG
jgi:hypothetical protein